MKRTFLVSAIVAALFGAANASAHSEHHKAAGGAEAAQPPVTPIAGKGGSGSAPDARSYFTDLELQTQDGRKVRFFSDVLEGRTVLINVIFTNCEDACPLITKRLNEVREQIPELFGKQVHFVSLSSDPKRDSPKALKKFAQKNHADVDGWTFLTGPKESIDHILKKMGQFSEHIEEHSTLIIAGNVATKRWSKIRPDAPPEAIVERLRILVASPTAAADKPN